MLKIGLLDKWGDNEATVGREESLFVELSTASHLQLPETVYSGSGTWLRVESPFSFDTAVY